MSQSHDSNASATSDPRTPPADVSHRRIAKHSKRRFRHRTAYARERDVYRQLQPWEATFTPPTLHRDPWPGINGPETPVPAQPCPDTALSAFAQLCALRLHARRCLVMLTCKEREFVLSDMTRTTSLQYDYFEDPLDAPWLGTCSFPRSGSINDSVIDEWQEAREVREPPAEVDHFYTEGVSPHYHIVSDLRHNARYRDIVMTRHAPWARFCLSVPLRGGHGSVIGSIVVVDDKPRHGVSAMEMKLMEDMSDTVVEHLEAVRVGVQRQRGDRLLQAIKTFNSGDESLRSWWKAEDDRRALTMGRNVDKGTARDQQLRECAQFGAHSSSDSRQLGESMSPSGKSESQSAAGAISRKAQPVKSKHMQRQTSRNQPEGKAYERPRPGDGFDLATASAEAYHRGANLLREALGLGAVLMVNTATSGRRTSSDGSDRSSDSTQDSQKSNAEGVRLCDLFASSLRKDATATDSATGDRDFNLSAAALKRLVRRYPDGNLFHIGADGTTHTSSSDTQSPANTDNLEHARQRLTRDGQTVQRSLKGARSIAFYPIWDDSMDRHRACIFAYSFREEPYRDRSEDLAYLSAFGHSMSATLTHLESVAADRAKGTFISSISHELRSPLHGVLAGCDLLQDSELTADQRDMCHTISMAGTTLLDTVNHILDYAKISSHVRAERQGGKVEDVDRGARNADQAGATTHLDLAQLTEEVTETTVVAYRAQRRPSISIWPEESRRPVLSNGDVSVILDIEPADHWHVEIQPGGWTRIIMNLLTNALKYTTKGQIRVTLQAEDFEEDDDGTKMRRVRLSVEDTGKGMSEDFVRHGAWLPFKQEDPHSKGTGLGLSIVHDIAKSIGANVDLSSQLGKGTKVEVSFLGRFVLQPALTLPDTQVRQFGMLSMVADHKTRGDDVGDDVLEDTLSICSVEASVRQTAAHWLQSNVVHIRADEIQRDYVCAITQQDLEEWQKRRPDQLAAVGKHIAAQNARLLVLAQTVSSTLTGTDFGPVLKPVYLQQPIGPRKLLRAVAGGDVGSNDRKQSAPGNSTGGLHISPNQEVVKRSLALRVDRKATAKNDGVASSTNKVPPSTSSEDTDSEGEAGNASEQKRNAEGPHGEQMALLVEDNDVNLKLLVALMKKLQLKYQCAAHGKEAYDVYRSRPDGYFLILMDISMPVMDGFTATMKIRALENKQRLPRTRIVALTGVTNQEAKRQAFDAGVDEYYAKPVRMKELRELVNRTQQSGQGQSSRSTG
ncbi:hypothetical protein DOTSEDRAFT_70797 [Dothistroma septosporum NZE10]|uniref:histidine kinase n=1 Tax=Dothistroma septosporum (strain NZE10 / CBS 128990) TaxID=675120 RepID=N1PN80_DOTSN|nr:hypothetical protein DOTSEDRAFT_70797 [Dothistroma septosporum NZE10]